MPNWKKVIVSGSNASLLTVNAVGFTGSLQGTASYAINALSASYVSGVGNSSLSSLTAATTSSIINNGNNIQTWRWDSLSGVALNLYTTSSQASGSAQTLLNLNLSGTNSNPNQITYGIYILNNHTGTNSTNIGLYAAAVGGTNNTAAYFLGDLVTESGNLLSAHSASGFINIGDIGISKMGDVDNYSNNTRIEVDDPNQIITIEANQIKFSLFPNANSLATDSNGYLITGSVSGSGIIRSIHYISSSLSLGSNAYTDYIYIVTGSSSVTLTLPTAINNKNRYTIKKAGTNIVTINTSFSQSIDNGNDALLKKLYETVDIISNNSNWFVI